MIENMKKKKNIQNLALVVPGTWFTKQVRWGQRESTFPPSAHSYGMARGGGGTPAGVHGFSINPCGAA